MLYDLVDVGTVVEVLAYSGAESSEDLTGMSSGVMSERKDAEAQAEDQLSVDENETD